MTQADAYRASYSAEKTKDKALWVKASQLMANGKVRERVNELRKPLEDKQLWTREMSVKALITAYKEGAASVKVSAVKELNLMHGFNAPTKIELNGKITSITRLILREK
jgi:hypothetical protein